MESEKMTLLQAQMELRDFMVENDISDNVDAFLTALESMQELERYRKTPLCGNCETRRTGMV